MNGIPPARFAVKRGTMGLTVALNPVAWGNLGINTMDAQLKGKAFDKKVFCQAPAGRQLECRQAAA